MHSMKAAVQHTIHRHSAGGGASKYGDGSAHLQAGSDAQVSVFFFQ